MAPWCFPVTLERANLIKLARDADVLVHEVIDKAWPQSLTDAQEGLHQHLIQAHNSSRTSDPLPRRPASKHWSSHIWFRATDPTTCGRLAATVSTGSSSSCTTSTSSVSEPPPDERKQGRPIIYVKRSRTLVLDLFTVCHADFRYRPTPHTPLHRAQPAVLRVSTRSCSTAYPAAECSGP
jgi:hypothetical protein